MHISDTTLISDHSVEGIYAHDYNIQINGVINQKQVVLVPPDFYLPKFNCLKPQSLTKYSV